MQNKKRLYDSRVVDRYVQKGMVDRKAYENYVKELPDDEPNGTWIQTDLHDAEFADEPLHNGRGSDE